MKNTCLSLVLILSISITGKSQKLPQLGKDPLKSVVAAMTLEEKASIVVGTSTRNQGTSANTNSPTAGQIKVLVQGAAGTTFAIPRLGIPSIVVADGPAGLRISPTRPNDQATYYCTAFPVATLLASTWDTNLANNIGKAMGNEVLEYGVDILLGPALNIHRNPLCGRNFEYLSEDPLITGKIAAAIVNGVESNGVGTSIKHFAANNAETNRNSLNTIISERALREIYLKGFGIAVHDAQPWTVMSSYNLINGFYASESYDLLTRVLRNDWSFKGFVMTDWGGGKDVVAQMKAGNDLLMPGNPNQSKAIVEAVSSGKLDAAVLDKNVERILEIILQTPRFKGYKFSNIPDLKAHALIARQAASEGMVLLKNSDSSLPLSADIKKIAAFGNTSYEIITGGTGSGDVNEAYSIALVEGLNNAGYSVDENLQSLYNAYLKAAKEGRQRGRGFMNGFVPVAEFAINSDIAGSMANVSDAALITIGRNSGEGSDRKAVEGDFLLTNEEKGLIKQVTTAFHAKNKKVIVVLNIGGVIETASWRDMPDAILLAWQAGQETGNSIADILSGKVNPSGKLASTFPVNYSDVPSANNFPGKVITPSQAPAGNQEVGQVNSSRRSQPSEITYEEGIYIGYRYYSTFKVPVSYEFGYGLSYTTFDYSNLKLSSPKFSSNFTVSVDIKNTGKVAGKEVAELYLSAPAGKLDKPERELKGFIKTKLLQPGETQTVVFSIDGNALTSFDTGSSSWIADPGKYSVMTGSSSLDIRQTGTFNLSKPIIVNKESKALSPAHPINELKPSIVSSANAAGTDLHWFTAKEAGPKVWQISDNGADNMYLIEGRDSSMLIDDGLGVADISSFVRKLTSKPLVIVITHGHPDHAGSDYQFEKVYIHPADSLAARDYNKPEARSGSSSSMLGGKTPAAEDLYKGRILNTRLMPIHEGRIFDLGGRKIEVIETPGHTPGEICLLDISNKLLFTGDNNNGLVWLFLNNCLPLHQYLASLQKQLKRINEFTTILPGHGAPIPSDFINDQVACVKGILDGSLERKPYQSFAGNAMVCVFGRASVTFNPDNL